MKNKILLSGTTALILAVAMNAKAELNVAADSLTADVQPAISVVEPATIQGGRILFPTISTGGGRKIVIKNDGTIDESQTTAQVIHADQNAYVEKIFISGGAVGYASGIMNNTAGTSVLPTGINFITPAPADLTMALAAPQAQVISFPTDPITLTDVSNNNSGICGTVKAFTAGPTAKTTRNNIQGAEFGFGATFEMAEGFHPTNGYARCAGTGTVTYFPNARFPAFSGDGIANQNYLGL